MKLLPPPMKIALYLSHFSKATKFSIGKVKLSALPTWDFCLFQSMNLAFCGWLKFARSLSGCLISLRQSNKQGSSTSTLKATGLASRVGRLSTREVIQLIQGFPFLLGIKHQPS
jgi:hypothetical protein